jgi:hypothetical protein
VVEKGMSLSERLQSLEMNTKKNTSSIQRIEGQVKKKKGKKVMGWLSFEQ